ncbi:MAG: outer membrane beta-barrel protein [Akkermansiaceae bacterium]
MKKTIAITSALAAVSSLATAEIKINDFLSFEGFVDMSYSHTDIDSDASGSDNENSFEIDQVEIDWLFNFDKVTARVDLGYEGSDNQSDAEVEQAYVSYDLGNGASITAGRYESMLGLEAKEPTGLYQFSTAYDDDNFLPQYAQGVKYTKQSDDLTYGISIQDESFDDELSGEGNLGGNDSGTYSIEAAVSLTSGALTYSLGGAWEDGDDQGDVYVVNGHVVYVNGAWTIGAEYNIGQIENPGGDDEDLTSGLIMANYAYSDCCSITGRISFGESEEGASDEDFIKYTLAHNYAVTDNLAIITEVSLREDEDDAGDDTDTLVGAVEVLFTF